MGWAVDGYAQTGSPSGCAAGGLVKITAPDGMAFDLFGVRVAADGDRLVVGAPGSDVAGISSGAAYVFQRSGASWVLEAQLTALDAADGDGLGSSVAISGNTVVVGANGRAELGPGAGAAYVFTRTSTAWVQQGKLLASDAAAFDRFGVSVAVDADIAAVGAHTKDSAGDGAGAAYVFVRDQGAWAEQARLIAADAAPGDDFGFSVAVVNQNVVVGSPFDDDDGAQSGSVYVYAPHGSSWVQTAKLRAPGGAASNRMGTSLAGFGNTIVVGVPGDDVVGNASGSVLLFTDSGSGWTLSAKLTPDDAASGDQFGWGVGGTDGLVVIGAIGADDVGVDSGAAYAFAYDETDWVQQVKLTAPDGGANERLGGTVGVSGLVAVMGVPSDDERGRAAGAIYVSDPVVCPPTSLLYRARNGETARGERHERIYIERDVGLSHNLFGYADYDPDGDGWAVVARTNGAGDNGLLARFWVDGDGPWVATRHSRKGCLSLTPKRLDEVRKGQTRLMDSTPDTSQCRAKPPSDDVDQDGVPDDQQPLYRLRDDGARIYLDRSVVAAEAQLGVSDWDPDGDGWSAFSRTNGSGEYGVVVDLVVDADGMPTLRVEHARRGCTVLLPNRSPDDAVSIGETRRLQVVARPGGTCAVP